METIEIIMSLVVAIINLVTAIINLKAQNKK